MKRNTTEISRDALREDVIATIKEDYHKEDLVMSEFLRSVDDLSLAEKKELLRWAGDDIEMVVLHNGDIVAKADVYEELVTGLNMVVEALGYDVEESGFGYSDDGLACVSGGDIDSFEEGFDWIEDELRGGYGSGPEGLQVVEGLNLTMRAIGFTSENGSEFVFEGIDEIYYMDNGNKSSMGDGLQALKMNLFEVGFLELTSDAISFTLDGSSYVVGWEKEFPDMLSFFDVEGDYSVAGSKEEIIEELQTMKSAEAVILEFAKQADVLLQRHGAKERINERSCLDEKITHAKENRSGEKTHEPGWLQKEEQCR